MKKICLLLLCTVQLLWACSEHEEPELPNDPAPLTILAYLVANNNLNEELYWNISTMYDGLGDMDVPATLLVYWDGISKIGENKANHLILKFTGDGKGNVNGKPLLGHEISADSIMTLAEIVKEYPEQMSTDKEVMSEVLKDMVAMSPTERVGLIAGSHGSAWKNTIYASRSFGQDGSWTDNTILVSDMAEAIKSTGRVFDFILFDACFMCTAEVCYDFKDVTDYLIASVMEVPAYGQPFDLMMGYLYSGKVENYKSACRAYRDYNKYYDDYGTMAVIDCREMQGLADAFKKQVVQHKDSLSNYDVSSLQEYGRSLAKYIAVDMEQFVKDLNGGVLPTDFEEQLNKTVYYKTCVEYGDCYPYFYGVDRDNFCGLGVYVPISGRPTWNSFFKTISWYTAAGWNEVTFSWNF